MSGIHDSGADATDTGTRVQAALRTRAERVTLGQDGVDGAWEQTLARKRRAAGPVPGGRAADGHRAHARKARRWTAPLAAAATVAVIGAGVGVAASLHPGGPGTVAVRPYRATVVSGAPGLTGPDAATLRSSPPISQVVLVKQVFGTSTSWTYLWFADVGWLSRRAEITGGLHRRLRLGAQRNPASNCAGMQSRGARHQLLSPFGFFVGQQSAFDQFGVAVRSVTSVTMQADTDKSEKIPASLIDGRGFPYKIFIVAFPATTKVENWKLVARDADGRQDTVPIPVATAF